MLQIAAVVAFALALAVLLIWAVDGPSWRSLQAALLCATASALISGFVLLVVMLIECRGICR